MVIRYADIVSSSVVDGLGVRVVAFLQGCPFRCEGCHNQALQSVSGGKEIPAAEFAELLLKKVTPLHKGITFSGGDPIMQADALSSVVKIVREKRPDLDIWLYTGFVFEDIMKLPVVGMIDVVVDGPFVLHQKDLNLPFRGSKNQRVINVSESLQKGRATELEIA